MFHHACGVLDPLDFTVPRVYIEANCCCSCRVSMLGVIEWILSNHCSTSVFFFFNNLWLIWSTRKYTKEKKNNICNCSVKNQKLMSVFIDVLYHIIVYVLDIPSEWISMSTSRILLHIIYSKNRHDLENPGNLFTHNHCATSFLSIY